MKNRLALTLGDPAGIGCEVALKFLESDEAKKYDITVFGHKFVIKKCYENILKSTPKTELNIIEPDDINTFNFEYGKHSKECGDASMKYIKKAVEFATDKKVDAIVTLPINKFSIHAAGYDFVGHTEYLSHLTTAYDISMMLAAKDLKTVLTTTHLPIKSVSNSLTEKKILTAINNAHNAGRYFGKVNPKIGVCGLNPHAGDNGALGEEEINLINPTIQIAKQQGINVDFCKPADTIYLDKTYDFIVAMYHDQALIPIKLLSFGTGVNVTLGLPIIRTSVDHGTAFDIATKSIAETTSLSAALDLANTMVNYDRSH